MKWLCSVLRYTFVWSALAVVATVVEVVLLIALVGVAAALAYGGLDISSVLGDFFGSGIKLLHYSAACVNTCSLPLVAGFGAIKYILKANRPNRSAHALYYLADILLAATYAATMVVVVFDSADKHGMFFSRISYDRIGYILPGVVASLLMVRCS